MRDIDSLVLVRQEGPRKVIYDFKTKKYFAAYEQPFSGGWQTNAWLLIQPFVIAGVEAGQRMLERLPNTTKRASAFVLFFLAACIAVTAWETYLSHGTKALRKNMKEIPQLETERLDVWERDITRRLRNALLIGVVMGEILVGLLVAFLCTGKAVLLTISIAVFSITYCILAAGRPATLWKYYDHVCPRRKTS